MACVQYIYRIESPYNLERKFYSVHEFAIDKFFRRKGAGTELFGFIKKDIKKKGFPKIEPDIWEFNEVAIKFYETQGFNLFRRFMEYQL